MAIIDDVADIREMLQLYFSNQEGFKVLFSVESAEKIPMHKINDLHILLCDIGLPGKSGMETTWLLKQKNPNLHVVMFTVFDKKETIFKTLQAGASGYLLKDTPLPKIKKALLDVMNNGAAMSPSIAKKVIAYFKPPSAAPQLTEREIEVVKRLQEGLSNQTVADRLEISHDTVKFHVKNIYRKLQVKNRMELLNYYKQA